MAFDFDLQCFLNLSQEIFHQWQHDNQNYTFQLNSVQLANEKFQKKY